MRKLWWAGLLGIFLLAFYLRVFNLPKNILTFGYDQARDAVVSQQILKGDLKILGPSASTPGIYHGVFYYYLLAPAYFFGHGNPVMAAYWIAFLNSLTVFVVYILAYLMTKKPVAGIIAAILFAVSFEATQYATWLSNPTYAILTVPIMYLGLWMWIYSPKQTKQSLDSRFPARNANSIAFAGGRGNDRLGPIICAIGLGLSIQAEIFLVYQIIPVAIWLWISRKEISKKQVFVFLLTLTLTLTSMIASEVKFGFKSIEGIKALAVSSETNLAYAKSLGDYPILYLNQIGRIFAFNSYPGNIGYGGALVVVLAVVGLLKSLKLLKSEKIVPEIFLATWLFSHLAVVTVGGTSTPFLMVGIGPAVSILLGIWISKWWSIGYKPAAVIITSILIFGNISLIIRENSKGSTLFAIQKDMLLSKQLTLIDYTYQSVGGQPFVVNSLTSPLWINIVWNYLYQWYGLPKYGYLPGWIGRDQVGQLNNLPKAKGGEKQFYLILEPMGGIPQRYLGDILAEADAKSTLVEEKYWGELRVQKREVVNKLLSY